MLKLTQVSSQQNTGHCFDISTNHYAICHKKRYSLENIGSMRVAYKVEIMVGKQEDKFQGCALNTGFIGPNQKEDISVTYQQDSGKYCLLISYEITEEKDITKCFVQDSVVNQFTV